MERAPRNPAEPARLENMSRVIIGQESAEISEGGLSDQRVGWRSMWTPVGVFVFSRVMLLCLTVWAHRLLGTAGPNASVLPPTDPLARVWPWASEWFRFDTAWYVEIAQHGYHWGAPGTANTNFMPLYPLLIKLLAPVALGNPWLGAWIISNVSALIATILLWHWAVERWGPERGARTVLLVTLFPFAFFLAAPYAEPLFLAFAIGTFILSEKDRWGPAICCAGISTIIRPVGVAVVLALVVMAIHGRSWRKAALASLAILPLLAFGLYLGLEFGQPLGFLTYHSAGWVPPHGGVGVTITSQFHTTLSPWDRVDAFVAIVFLMSIPLVWTRIGPAHAAFSFVAVALPLVHGLVSMERYATVVFPVMASWAAWRSRWIQFALFGASLLGLILATELFLTGASIF